MCKGVLTSRPLVLTIWGFLCYNDEMVSLILLLTCALLCFFVGVHWSTVERDVTIMCAVSTVNMEAFALSLNTQISNQNACE